MEIQSVAINISSNIKFPLTCVYFHVYFLMRNAAKGLLTSLTLFRVNDVQSQRNIFATIHVRRTTAKQNT